MDPVLNAPELKVVWKKEGVLATNYCGTFKIFMCFLRTTHYV